MLGMHWPQLSMAGRMRRRAELWMMWPWYGQEESVVSLRAYCADVVGIPSLYVPVSTYRIENKLEVAHNTILLAFTGKYLEYKVLKHL
jgi:hypothetical protein